MSGYNYPSDAVLLKEVEQYGNVEAYAVALGVSESALRRYIKKQGLTGQVKKIVVKPFSKPKAMPGDEVSREETLEQEVRELRKALRDARSEDVREERVIQLLSGALKVQSPRYKPKVHKPGKQAPHEFVLMLSDLHAAEVVNPEEISGANAYDWSIMMSRLDDLRRGLLSYQEHRPYPVEVLHIAALGDLLSGQIHEELAETNEMPMAEATVQLGLDLGEWVASLIPHFKSIRIASVVGNHPRPTKKMRAKQRYDNGDWTCMQVLKTYLGRYDSVSVEVPKPQKYPIEVCGKRLLLMHGDGIRSSMVDLPVGGVVRFVQKLQNQYAQMGIPIDHALLGHWHEFSVFRAGKVIVNGSLKGVDEYSLERFGGGSSPMQTLLTFHPDHGLTDLSVIDCKSMGTR